MGFWWTRHHRDGWERDRVRERRLEGGVTGRQAGRAIQAGLEVTGGGTANAVERDSENGVYWEVEVRTPDGRVVDVRLSRDYSVAVIEGDSEATDTDDAGS
jgi:uncharacterized membrane protein YkoI